MWLLCCGRWCLTIAEAIEDLARAEDDAAKRIEDDIHATPSYGDWPSIARRFFLANRCGGNIAVNGGSDTWGLAESLGATVGAKRHIPVLQQLFIFPSLILDLPAYRDDDELRVRFGMGQASLIKLANKGMLHFNLIEYESEKQNGFARYSSSPGIERFLDHEQCRIHSVRRERMFNAIGFATATVHPQILSKGVALLRAAERLPPDVLLQATNQPTPEGALKQLHANWHYVKCLASRRPAAVQWASALPDEYSIDSAVLQAISELRGIKHALATPLTAVFGGITTYTPEHMYQIATTGERFNLADGRVLHGERVAGMAAMEAFLRNIGPDRTPTKAIELPVVADSDMEWVCRMLRDGAFEKVAALKLLDRIATDIDDSKLESVKEWRLHMSRVQEQQQLLGSRVLPWAGATMTGVAASLVTHAAISDATWAAVVAFVSATECVQLVLKYGGQAALARILTSNRACLIAKDLDFLDEAARRAGRPSKE